jgi:hypothetical protein
MPYAVRDESGRIIALYSEPRAGAEECLAGDHPEVLAFIADQQDGVRASLFTSDVETVRVIEDLVDVLVAKKLILLTDLPDAARSKLLERRRLRQSLSDVGDVMVSEQDIL